MQVKRLATLIPDGITRHGIEGLIHNSNHAHYNISSFHNFEAFERQADTADVLLMDISNLLMQEIEVRLLRLKNRCEQARMIVISDQFKIQEVKGILQLGVKGFIFRDDLSEALISSIDLVARDIVAMSSEVLQLLTTANQLYTVNDLKSLDMNVLRLMAEGLTVKAIAARLNVSTRSVYRSRDKLREVLDVATIEKLLDAAREHGLLD